MHIIDQAVPIPVPVGPGNEALTLMAHHVHSQGQNHQDLANAIGQLARHRNAHNGAVAALLTAMQDDRRLGTTTMNQVTQQFQRDMQDAKAAHNVEKQQFLQTIAAYARQTNSLLAQTSDTQAKHNATAQELERLYMESLRAQEEAHRRSMEAAAAAASVAPGGGPPPPAPHAAITLKNPLSELRAPRRADTPHARERERSRGKRVEFSPVGTGRPPSQPQGPTGGPAAGAVVNPNAGPVNAAPGAMEVGNAKRARSRTQSFDPVYEDEETKPSEDRVARFREGLGRTADIIKEGLADAAGALVPVGLRSLRGLKAGIAQMAKRARSAMPTRSTELVPAPVRRDFEAMKESLRQQQTTVEPSDHEAKIRQRSETPAAVPEKRPSPYEDIRQSLRGRSIEPFLPSGSAVESFRPNKLPLSAAQKKKDLAPTEGRYGPIRRHQPATRQGRVR